MEMPQVCVVLSGHTVDEMLKDAALAMAAEKYGCMPTAQAEATLMS